MAAKKTTAKRISIQANFAQARAAMKSALVDRDGEIDLVLTALIAGEHPLLVGDPGTGKSLLLDSLMAWMGTNDKFQVLFNRYTVPEEVYGPVSVQGLKEDKYRRITTNKLPEAVVAFADEIFKASSAILNTMLRILNERQFDNGDGTFRDCPLRICVAASNEWPGDQEGGGADLGALFDRFLFRRTVRRVSKSHRGDLLWNRNHKPEFTHTITPGQLDTATEEALDLEWTEDAKVAYVEMLDALEAEGVCPGDRRIFKAVDAAKAYAYLNGADKVERIHLEILADVLWEDPKEQPEICAKVVHRIANPVRAMVNEKLMAAEDVVRRNNPTEAVPKLQAIQAELNTIDPDDELVKSAVHTVAKLIKVQYNQVIGV